MEPKSKAKPKRELSSLTKCYLIFYNLAQVIGYALFHCCNLIRDLMTVIILKSVIVTGVTLKCICSACSFMCMSIVTFWDFEYSRFCLFINVNELVALYFRTHMFFCLNLEVRLCR
jgi:hypothetical protein